MSTSAIIFLIFIALAIYAVWWSVRGGGKRQREAARQEILARGKEIGVRGWRYEAPEVGDIKYRIHGTSAGGLAWSMYYHSDQSSSSSTPKLIFEVPSLTKGKWLWAINDRRTSEIVQNRALKWVVGGAAAMLSALSDDIKSTTAFYKAANSLPAGSHTFQARYILTAIAPQWTRLIDDEVERLILDWPPFDATMTIRDNCFSAYLEPKGLSVKLYADAPSMAVIDQMAKLGQLLADKSRSPMVQ